MATDLGLFQVVDETDSSTVLFDLNDETGAANAGGLKTVARELMLRTPELDAVRLESGSRPGGRTVFARDPFVATNWQQSIMGSANDTYDEFVDGFGQMFRTLRAGGRIRFQFSGSSDVRYMDFEPANGPALFGENPEDAFRALTSHRYPGGIPIAIIRQPYLLGPQIDPSVNKLANPTLALAASGRPVGWTWDATGNIASESIEALTESYRFNVTSTTARAFGQTTSPAAPGDVWTAQFEGMLGSPGRLKARIEFLTAGNSVLATHDTATFQTPASFARITVTSAAAPATTAKVRMSIVVNNSSSGTATYRVRRAQLAKEAAPSLFVCGPEIVACDPVVGYGRTFPVYVQGDTPAAAILELTIDSGRPVAALVGTRTAGGITGGLLLTDYLNGAGHIQAEAFTLTNDAEVVTDANASGGQGVAAGASNRQKTGANFTTTTTPSISWPAATAAKSKRHLVLITNTSPTVITPPTDYSLEATRVIGAGTVRVYGKDGSSADSGAVTLTLSASASGSLMLIETVGTLKSGASLQASANRVGTSTALTITSTTPPSQTDEVVLAIAVQQSLTATLSDETKSFRQLQTQTGALFRAWAYEAYPGTTSAITYSATSSASAAWLVIMLQYKLEDAGRLVRYMRRELTSVDSITGTFEVRARMRAGAPGRIGLQLRWAASTLDACDHLESMVSHDTSAAAFAGVAYVEKSLGRIVVPEQAAGLTLEIWGQCDPVTGAGFVLDRLSLEPATPETESETALTMGSTLDTVLGSEMVAVSPPSPGTTPVIDGTDILMPNGQAIVGDAPLAGNALPAARHIIVVELSTVSSPDFIVRVRNITDAVDVVTIHGAAAAGHPEGLSHALYALQFDSVAGKLYQVQVEEVAGVATPLRVHGFKHQTLPAMAVGETIRMDPNEFSATRRDTNGKVLSQLQVAGGVPAWLLPGLNLIRILVLDMPPTSGYSEDESRLAAAPTLRVTYAPGYYH